MGIENLHSYSSLIDGDLATITLSLIMKHMSELLHTYLMYPSCLMTLNKSNTSYQNHYSNLLGNDELSVILVYALPYFLSVVLAHE